MTGDQRKRTIVGTVIIGESLHPFVLDPATNTIRLDVYDPTPAGEVLVIAETDSVVETVSKLLGSAVNAVRPGEYYCSACRNWLPADRNCWSMSICMSCSLDRGSELAEYYDKLERPAE
jgi:hypothetical protein